MSGYKRKHELKKFCLVTCVLKSMFSIDCSHAFSHSEGCLISAKWGNNTISNLYFNDVSRSLPSFDFTSLSEK